MSKPRLRWFRDRWRVRANDDLILTEPYMQLKDQLGLFEWAAEHPEMVAVVRSFGSYVPYPNFDTLKFTYQMDGT